MFSAKPRKASKKLAKGIKIFLKKIKIANDIKISRKD